jgi:hypothetical protein
MSLLCFTLNTALLLLLLLLLATLRYEVRTEGGIVQMYDHGGFTFIPNDRFFGVTSFKYTAVVSTTAASSCPMMGTVAAVSCRNVML